MKARSSGNGIWIGVSKSSPAPSGSITVVPPEAKSCAIWSWPASAAAETAGTTSKTRVKERVRVLRKRRVGRVREVVPYHRAAARPE